MSLPLKILFFGDIVGKAGRRAVIQYLERERPEVDLIIANVENTAHGFGVQEQHIEELAAAGIDIFTGGNHTFDRKEIFEFIDRYPKVLRPANYPEGTIGKGYCIADVNGEKVAVLNILGRVFMDPLDSPFYVADKLLQEIRQETDKIFVDFHAEATAEKIAFARYLDGRVSAVVGTHTHVQTADERILPKGTAFLTDAGCCAAIDSVIGMEFPGVMRRMVQQLPARFEVADGAAEACGVFITINPHGQNHISRLRYQEKTRQ